VFHTRCWKAQERCRVEVPEYREIKPGHRIACHFPEERTVLGEVKGSSASSGLMGADEVLVTAVDSPVTGAVATPPTGAEFADPTG
jgi:hypothetical protein